MNRKWVAFYSAMEVLRQDFAGKRLISLIDSVGQAMIRNGQEGQILSFLRGCIEKSTDPTVLVEEEGRESFENYIANIDIDFTSEFLLEILKLKSENAKLYKICMDVLFEKEQEVRILFLRMCFQCYGRPDWRANLHETIATVQDIYE